ncbi:MAG: sulfite exporter TauE/SafE family protein [Tissierellia bacterium]|nr:sulfite exporter TauE/SafE family protein [Tissierellia bacterium]
MTTAVLLVLAIFGLVFTIIFVKDIIKNKDKLENNSWVKLGGIGFVTNFFDALGIGSFATATALLKIFDQSEDRLIPGTLNVGFTLAVILEAFIFIKSIEVEPLTLVSMILAATIGAWIGAGIVSKFSEKKVQKVMGFALFLTALLMLAGKLGIMPSGGMEIGLNGWKLLLAVIANFLLGALMTAGIGLYAPCMALVYALGMSPRVAFTIMFGSCAFLMPVASIRFIKEDAYNRKASIAFSTVGLLGVIVATYIVKTMPIEILTWVVIGVVLYTSYTMLKASKKKNNLIDSEILLDEK